MTLYMNCENLEIRMGSKALISKFNFSIKASETTAITGANGVGKTSLLRVIAGLSKPYFGKIDLLHAPKNLFTNKIPLIFLANQPALLLDQSVKWNLDFYTQSYGLFFSNQNYNHALNAVGLTGRELQIVRSLSTGQKRRLTLAVLTLIKPKIILADEPTNGLDEAGIELCLEIFKNLQAQNESAIVIATHDLQLIRWTQTEINLSKYIPNQVKNIKSEIKVLL